MEYTHLGQTDIRVSKMCVGAMSFGKAGTMHQWSLDEDASAAIVKHALDLGILRGDERRVSRESAEAVREA